MIWRPTKEKKLTKVRVQFSGRPTGDLYVFTDDQVVHNKPMENVVENGVTTFDLSTENIVIEAGKSLKVGYLLTSDGGGIWPLDRRSGMPGNRQRRPDLHRPRQKAGT